MRVIQESFCQLDIAEESAPTTIMGTHVRSRAQQIAKSFLARPVAQRTMDFARAARPANGMAILAASLAARAVLKELVTKVRVNVIEAAKTDGGEKHVSTNVQQVPKEAAIATTGNRRIVCQDRSQLWRMMAQEFARRALRIVNMESVMTMALAVKGVYWVSTDARVTRIASKLAKGHAMLEQLTKGMGIVLLV